MMSIESRTNTRELRQTLNHSAGAHEQQASQAQLQDNQELLHHKRSSRAGGRQRAFLERFMHIHT